MGFFIYGAPERHRGRRFPNLFVKKGSCRASPAYGNSEYMGPYNREASMTAYTTGEPIRLASWLPRALRILAW